MRLALWRLLFRRRRPAVPSRPPADGELAEKLLREMHRISVLSVQTMLLLREQQQQLEAHLGKGEPDDRRRAG